MKTRVLFGVLLAVGVPLQAQTTSEPPPPVGQKAKQWVVQRRLWMNTPRPIWLGGLRGHVVVLDFFRINCSHCIESAPSRRALFERFAPQGMKMIGFQSAGQYLDPANSENNWASVRATVKRWELPYPVAFDDKSQLFRSYNFDLYPTVLVLDSKGVVRFQETGFSPEKARALEHAIQSLVEETQHLK